MLSQATAQPPGGKGGRGKAKGGGAGGGASLVERMMAFDKNKDGKLTRDEITDERLLRLFDQADTNKDGVVTKEELEALAKKLDAEAGEGGFGKGGFGKGGFGKGGGKGGFGGPGGPGGRGFGGPPQPGQVLPPFLVERLELTAEQKKQLDALQKDVDARLAKILTSEQKKQLEAMRQPFGPGGRGPGGPPPGGPGGPPPGGPPPGDSAEE
jgi:hypothetical protein